MICRICCKCNQIEQEIRVTLKEFKPDDTSLQKLSNDHNIPFTEITNKLTDIAAGKKQFANSTPFSHQKSLRSMEQLSLRCQCQLYGVYSILRFLTSQLATF